MSWKKQPILVFDTETTGLNASGDRIIEFAWTSYEAMEIHGEGSFLFSIPTPVPEFITSLTGIKDEDLKGQPRFEEFIPHLEELMLQHPIFAGYNVVGFDKHFLTAELARAGATHVVTSLLGRTWLDPFIWIKHFQKYEKGKKLTQVAERLGIKIEGAHRALADAKACMEIMVHYMPKLPSSLPAVLELQNKWAQESDAHYSEWKSKREEIAENDDFHT